MTAFRGLADNIARFCKKREQSRGRGRIQIRNYEDNNGQRRTFVDVVADDVEFLTPKNSGASDDDYAPAAPKKKPALEPFEDDGDIPF